MRRAVRRRRNPGGSACGSATDRAPPCLELRKITDPGMRRARGREQAVLELACRGQVRQDPATPGMLRLAAVEADAADCRMLGEEARKVVDADRVLPDRGVEAPGADAAFQHVPERDPAALQR